MMFWLRLDVISKPKSLMVLICILGGDWESVKWAVDAYFVSADRASDRNE